MRRPLLALLGCALCAAALAAPARAADAPPVAGNWKVKLFFPQNGAEITLWIVKVEDKDGKLQGEVLASTQVKNAKVESVQADARALRLTLAAPGAGNFAVTAYLPRGEARPKELLGSCTFRNQRFFAELDRTTDTELDAKAATDPKPAEAIQGAMMKDDAAEKEKALRAVAAKYPRRPAGLLAHLLLIQQQVKDEAAPDAVRTEADAALKVAAAFGPEIELNALAQITRGLAGSEKLAPLAVEYGRKGEKLISADTAPALSVTALKALASALKKAGKADDAKAVAARVAKLEDALDQEFIKANIPFKPDTYAGRKGKSERVVLVELFTGAQCPPCVAADVAFDALLKTYKPAEVVFLQYHEHIPGPDPLTNAGTEARAKYYAIEGTPTFYIDGKDGPGVGGPRDVARRGYAALSEKIDAQLEKDAGAGLKVRAARKGDVVAIQAEVSDLKKTGDDIRLRFVLVEDVVRYPGTNGQRLHHHVVRDFPGGVEGVAMKEKSGKHVATVNLPELTRKLEEYLTNYAKRRAFPGDDRPLDLKHLKVVAFIQDNDTKEVLQAAQVDVREAK
ncbi:MAG TPA: hypothetical protein VFA26_19575 [Gemmataceae bacterium]|nr:hypothetical protein [Gemmataceae bacterium]